MQRHAKNISCFGCDRNFIIVNKKYNLCQICNRKRLHPNEERKYHYIKPKPKKLSEDGKSESDVFREIWRERPHVCINCEGLLGNEMRAHYFSHDEPGKYDRHNKKKISIRCKLCHDAYDHSTRDKYNARKGINRGKYIGFQLYELKK